MKMKTQERLCHKLVQSDYIWAICVLLDRLTSDLSFIKFSSFGLFPFVGIKWSNQALIFVKLSDYKTNINFCGYWSLFIEKNMKPHSIFINHKLQPFKLNLWFLRLSIFSIKFSNKNYHLGIFDSFWKWLCNLHAELAVMKSWDRFGFRD